MGRIRQIPRTAAFAWSTSIARPLVATGTRAGAVDSDFSDETKLELWDLDSENTTQDSDIKPLSSIVTDSRFFDIAWGEPDDNHPEGIIAGALENGSLDLWDAAKLRSGASDALIQRVSKHTGPIKALQFNPHRPELLATCGAKGELYITDINNPANPFRVGTSARADDFDCLDWNKKVPHILVTGSSGGFVTVWDIKAKKENLTLNNLNRKPVSAVAWNPDVPTKLATAIPTEQDPLIVLWDLRNAGAPEKILKGHEEGVLSLAWCPQDSDLLLSCGKDNRNICWNPHTGEQYGEFQIVTNWTFQTRWNPRHPGFLATASFDGKVAIQSIQNTKSTSPQTANSTSQATDGADFFAQTQTQPQSSSFSLSKPPKWMKRPVGASFGFGGKLVTFKTPADSPKKSKVELSTFVSDSSVESSIADFQKAMSDNDISSMCASRVERAQTDSAKEDWRVIKALVATSPRKSILSYLGFDDPAKEDPIKAADSDSAEPQTNGRSVDKTNRLSAFFDESGDSSQFLADLAASKGARTNNPFQIYKGSESDTDKAITRALMLGSFDDALDICLKEKRMSDAFMIAICGGQKCIDKAQAAFFAQQSEGPNYLRLLASVVGKNLWDVVYNADLSNWKEVMATLCTFADEKEFPDLCEALGDRLHESDAPRKDASFCYLAGSKLEKVVPIWVSDMQQSELARSGDAKDESAFSIHVQSLQNFIEKVSIFRRATQYQDKENREEDDEWKLDLLYTKYEEYADVLASYGHLDMADQYLSLLPSSHPAAEVARNRVKQATGKAAQPAKRSQPAAAFAPAAPSMTSANPSRQPMNSYMPNNSYTAPGAQPAFAPQPSASSYGPSAAFGGPYQGPAQSSAPPPGSNAPPSAPPRATANGSNWNDLPESFAVKPPVSRRNTPAPVTSAVPSPFANQPNPYATPNAPPQFTPARIASPIGPPPRAGSTQPPPGSISSLADRTVPSMSPPPRPSSSAANAYAPPTPQPGLSSMPASMVPPQRGASPYNAPPAGAPPSNRYAPAPGAQTTAIPRDFHDPNAARAIAPNPYASQTPPPTSAYAPSQPQSHGQAPYSGPPPMARGGPPPGGPPPGARPPSTGALAAAQAAAVNKYPSGDRSHISVSSQPIFECFSTEMLRIKPKAPANYRQQVEDTEKRLNMLYDLLNNDTLPASAITQLLQIVQAIDAKSWEHAMVLHTDLMKIMEQGGPWLVGVKRLIIMGKATPA